MVFKRALELGSESARESFSVFALGHLDGWGHTGAKFPVWVSVRLWPTGSAAGWQDFLMPGG